MTAISEVLDHLRPSSLLEADKGAKFERLVQSYLRFAPVFAAKSSDVWFLDRYQAKTDKASGIVNDPNEWSKEVSDPWYIIDLLARIGTVSLETMAIVDALPAPTIREDQNPA